MAELAPVKRTRRARRNYQREMAELEAYCKTYIEVLQESQTDNERTAGKITAFMQVQAKIREFAQK